MSLTATERQVVSALVSLRVPRGEAGDLDSGVVDVLEAVDGVDSVEIEGVTGVRPTWTDIHVDADVRLSLGEAADVGSREADSVHDDGERVQCDLDTVRTTLEDGFGVTGVEELRRDDRQVP